ELLAAGGFDHLDRADVLARLGVVTAVEADDGILTLELGRAVGTAMGQVQGSDTVGIRIIVFALVRCLAVGLRGRLRLGRRGLLGRGGPLDGGRADREGVAAFFAADLLAFQFRANLELFAALGTGDGNGG